MKKAIVVGSSGSGKTTFAVKLAEATGLPIYHLDAIFWHPDKTHISREEFDMKLAEILKKDSFIIDGDYARTYEERFFVSDTIFFFDLPLEECLSGVENRVGKKRCDLPWVENEFDPEFKQWIIDWHEKRLPMLNELIEKYRDGRDIIVFKSRKEADAFIEKAMSQQMVDF